MKDIFISFVEEAVLNLDFQGYIGGRIEVSFLNDLYPSEEIRFFTKDVENFHTFRDAWDMLEITRTDLDYIRKVVREAYNES